MISLKSTITTIPRDSPFYRRLLYSFQRWIDLLALTVVGTLAFRLILPLTWSRAQDIPFPYPPLLVSLAVFVATTLLTYLFAEPVRIRTGHWTNLIWYPPTWLVVPLACALAALSEQLPTLRPDTVAPSWHEPYTLVPIALAVIFGLAARQLPWRKSPSLPPQHRPAPAPAPHLTWSEIAAWLSSGERPLTGTERDLFRRHTIAARMAKSIAADHHNVALLGRFGSGKSSTLNFVKAELARRPGTLLVAEFDVWAVPNPVDVPRVALDEIVEALGVYVDTIRFRSLPIAYQRLVSKEPTGWFSAAVDARNVHDSISLLGSLSKLLFVIDARLLLIVQDAERAGATFDLRHLQRLLWALHSTSRLQFVLSVDPHHALLDFSKLCDSIELLPEIEVDHVARILTVAYRHWRTEFSDIDPHPSRHDADKLELELAAAGGTADYLRRTGRDTPLDALVSLLDTPRALKHVLRRVDRVWDRLHGEVELDDLLIVSVLRYAAEPVYRFLLVDIDAARHDPTDILPRTKGIEGDWADLIKQLPNGPSAQALVNRMGIKQLTKGIGSGVDSPQGLQKSDPVDYFRRIVAEELGPSELRDQSVLRDIDRWKDARDRCLLDHLLSSSDPDSNYELIWENFSHRHTNAELLQLTEQVVAMIKKRDGAAANADHDALLALWRQCNQRLPNDKHGDWLQTLIVEAVPVSLRLARGLFYYWAGQHGIVNDATRAHIMQSIVATVRTLFRTGDDLAAVLTPNDPYLIRRLVAQACSDDYVAALATWNDCLPTLLIAVAKTRADLAIPEIANIAATGDSLVTVGDRTDPPKFVNSYEIERSGLEAFFGKRLDEVLELLANYTGDNAYAIRAVAPARQWVAERRGGPAGAHVP